jgi:hypothetical protein
VIAGGERERGWVGVEEEMECRESKGDDDRNRKKIGRRAGDKCGISSHASCSSQHGGDWLVVGSSEGRGRMGQGAAGVRLHVRRSRRKAWDIRSQAALLHLT